MNFYRLNNRSPSHRPQAFTLIELLVVIAVIAVLASLLIPALAKAKMKTTGARCQGNERQMQLAFTMYSDDNGGTMPWKEYNRVPMPGGGYWAGPQPAISGGMSMDAATKAVQKGLSMGPLWKYCFAFEAYHCPGDLRYKYRKPGAHWAYDSYSKADGMNGDMWSLLPIVKLDLVPEPANAMVFVEEAESRNFNNGTWVINADTHGWVDPVAIFHNGTSTISFADGHAEIHRWLEKSTIDQAAAAQKNLDTMFYWTKAPNDRDFAWIEPRYKYKEWPKYLK